MICADFTGMVEEEFYVGIQRPDLSYTYTHWPHGDSSSKFIFCEYGVHLQTHNMIEPIGPDCLVEWVE